MLAHALVAELTTFALARPPIIAVHLVPASALDTSSPDAPVSYQ